MLLMLGFIGGRLYQHATTGYHFIVNSKKEYPFRLATVHWSLVTESVGLPIHDPGTTMIEWNDRTLYKAKRDFQEKGPFAGNIRTSDSTIEWDDGEYSYHLTIAELAPAELKAK